MKAKISGVFLLAALGFLVILGIFLVSKAGQPEKANPLISPQSTTSISTLPSSSDAQVSESATPLDVTVAEDIRILQTPHAVVSIDPYDSTPPTPTAISISSLDLIYYDDFSSDESGWNYHSDYDVDRGLFSIDHGGGRSSSRFHSWKEIGIINNSKFYLQVDVVGPFEETDHAGRGLGFGSLYGGLDGIYTFGLKTDGTCQFVRYVDTLDYSDWFLKTEGYIEDFDNKQGHYVIGVYIDYQVATGYIDGKYCASLAMEEYKPGYVGVYASPGYVGTDSAWGETYFDEFKVFKPR